MSLIRKVLVLVIYSASFLGGLFGMTACSSMPRVITEYRIDVQQGNVLTQEMVAQLRPGLTADQVRYVLGTPVLTDVFHAKRWDYVYRLQRGIGTEPVLRRFSVFFDDAGLLSRVDGDLEVASPADLQVAPTRSQMIELGSVTEGTELAKTPVEEKGWWAKAKESIGF